MSGFLLHGDPGKVSVRVSFPAVLIPVNPVLAEKIRGGKMNDEAGPDQVADVHAEIMIRRRCPVIKCIRIGIIILSAAGKSIGQSDLRPDTRYKLFVYEREIVPGGK